MLTIHLPRFCPLLCILTMLFSSSAFAAEPSHVTLGKSAAGAWELRKDGQPFPIHGVGGNGSMDLAREIGANSVRTWGVEQLEAKDAEGRNLLDAAQARGMMVCAGIWVEHGRHGFKYDDPASVEKQREKTRAAVRRYKDHPALLVWGLGNEMETDVGTEAAARVWRELDQLARIVKEEDPNHPVMTVIAGADTGKIKEIMKYYPSIDILGINAYAGAGGAGATLQSLGWDKPFVMAEYGPVGHWEGAKTPWGAALEPNGNEKAANYYATLSTLLENTEGLCLGSYAFLWGQKQETTATWYGMLLSSGEKLPPVDAVARGWSGKWPTNRCPILEKVGFPTARHIGKPGEKVKVHAEVRDPEGDKMSYEWSVLAESTDLRFGGDAETVPPSFPQCIPADSDSPELTLTLPEKKGFYRLFLVVRDGRGAATTANFPFGVE